LFENLNIIIWCCNIQVSSPFLRLLKPYNVHNIWKVAHGHVCKFFQRELKINKLLCSLKMSFTIDVKLSKIWGERICVWEGWKQYMYHKSSPLPHTKVPKIEPIFQLLKSNFINYLWGIPPTSNCCILNICLFQRNGIFIFIAQRPMFFSQL
jgi:hypothetical protein